MITLLKELSFEDMISKTKIGLRKMSPFFSYLVEHLRIKETKEVPTAGVDKKSNLYVNPDFIKSLGQDNNSRAQMFMGVFVHEVMHLALKHPDRCSLREVTVSGKNARDVKLFNVATDIVINNILVQNGFNLPSEGLIPSEDSITVFGKIKIDNISEKCAEDIYEELKTEIQKGIKDGSIKTQKGSGGMDLDMDIPNPTNHDKWDSEGDGGGSGEGEEKEEKGKGKGKPDKGEGVPETKGVDWTEALAKANTFAKMQGHSPLGLGVEYHSIHKAKIKWNNILKKEVARSIPFDMTYAKPNRHYLWMNDIYMPTSTGESVKVLASIDTSGSISERELSDFISELIGISRTYRGQVEFRVLSHDTIVHDDILITNGKGEKALKQMKLHGGGGTDHNQLYDYIVEKGYARDTKLLISFTDGYSSFPEHNKVKTVFVLSGGHCGKDQMPGWSHKVLTLD
jgi:predicted metal-dependent peptidase